LDSDANLETVQNRRVRVLPWVAAQFSEWERIAVAGDLHAKASAEAEKMRGEVAAMLDNRVPGPAPEFTQLELTKGMMNGSQAKTAMALRLNCERMIAGHDRRKLVEIPLENGETGKAWQVAGESENLNCTGFLTLTVGDVGRDGKFQQVFDAAEASRRINNLNRRILRDLFERAVIVTERHHNAAIHFHVLGVLRSRVDIRTGFNFDEVARRNYASACPHLRELWKMLREKLPEYGFGRAELTPIRKTGEAVACYVSKYIEKNVCNRLADDKGKKLVRYLGWGGEQLKPNGFSWATPRARAWRAKTRECCALIGADTREQAAEALGPRWAFHVSQLWARFSDQVTPFIVWPDDWGTREFVRNRLGELAGKFWCEKSERGREFTLAGEKITAREWLEYRATLENLETKFTPPVRPVLPVLPCRRPHC
jgi:hypothetical protein